MAPTRRHLLAAGAFAGLSPLLPGALWADLGPRPPRRRDPALLVTPHQVEGPYYPGAQLLDRLYGPDRDNDLVRRGEGRAGGVQLWLLGVVRRPNGRPLGGAEVDLWQTCHRGKYLHGLDEFGSRIPRDEGFQYYGRCRTADDGSYAFRTVIPRRYPSGAGRDWWRPPHLHLKVLLEGQALLTTQLYLDDPLDPDNDWRHLAVREVDHVIARVPEQRRHELVAQLREAGRVDRQLVEQLGQHGLELVAEAEDRRWGVPRTGRFDLVVDPG